MRYPLCDPNDKERHPPLAIVYAHPLQSPLKGGATYRERTQNYSQIPNNPNPYPPMTLPKDPAMLYSIINMKLRDQYTDLDDLCASLDIDPAELTRTLAAAGYHYDPATNTFR